MLGVYPLKDALMMAETRGVDLVLLNAASDPPLCRLIEWSRYKYEMEKQTRVARQKQRASRVDQKELKMRPSTDTHDYQVRVRKAIEEIGRGNHVRLIVQYRGRELQNKEEGEDLLKRFVADVGDIAMVDKRAMMEGARLTMTLAPKKA